MTQPPHRQPRSRCRSDWWTPAGPLVAVLRGAWQLRGDWQGDDHLLPGMDIDIVVRVQGAVDILHRAQWQSLPEIAVVGSLGHSRRLRQAGPVHLLGIRLSPIQLIRLKIRAAELRDRIVSLDDVAPALRPHFQLLAETATAGLPSAALSGLVSTLLTSTADAPDRAIDRAIRLLEAGATVSRAAAAAAMCERQLHRRILTGTGWAPSDLRRFGRFSRLARLASEQPQPRWTELSQAAGYFDHAHMMRDFRAFTGTRPTELFSPSWRANFAAAALSDSYKSDSYKSDSYNQGGMRRL